MTPQERLEFVNYLIFLRGKLQSLSIRLAVDGLETEAVDRAEASLAEAIRTLRVRIMQNWAADATQTMAELRRINDNAQRKVRELEAAVDKVAKAAEIAGLIDRGLAAVMNLVV